MMFASGLIGIRKLSILRSVKFLERNSLDLLHKITVTRSIIDYKLPIYSNNLTLARLDRLLYKAKLVTGALHYSTTPIGKN